MAFRLSSIRGAHAEGGGEIDYRLRRQTIVTEFRKGRLARHEVCDAHPELMRAARNIGEASPQECPICEDANVVFVSYAFGRRLPAQGRCITSPAELAELAQRPGGLSCYVVEVCPECSWNHLARSFVLAPAQSQRSAR
jgi:hypothetical protein